MIYERRHSRSLMTNKGILRAMPLFTIIWFILALLNFAGPFRLNLFREILIIGGVIRLRAVVGLPVLFMCFFSAAYNLNLYAITQQGGPIKAYHRGGLNSREGVVLGGHVAPALMLLGALLVLSNNIKSM